ncbi:MAG: DUF87 domain-containing protein [Bacteriovoracia bacterium]
MAKATRSKVKPLFDATTVTSILGMRGCGKTYLSRKIQEMYPRVIIIDVTGEYRDGTECYDFEEFVDALRLSLKQEKFRIIFHSHMDAGAEEKSVIEQCIRLAMIRSSAKEADYNNLLLVLEEVQNYSTAHALPHYLRYAYLTGRHEGVALLATSQRPAEVHKTILSQSHNLFVGMCQDANDVKWLSSRLKGHAERLYTLPERKFFLQRGKEEIKILNNDLVLTENVVDTKQVDQKP